MHQIWDWLDICSAHDFSEARGQGHSDPETVCGTSHPQDISTHQIILNNIADMLWTRLGSDGRMSQMHWRPVKKLYASKVNFVGIISQHDMGLQCLPLGFSPGVPVF